MRGFLQDTIVAPATAAGAAGLAVVRLSGPEAIAIGARLFEGADLAASESHRAHHGWVIDARGERIDEALALVLRAPRGYTGEDTIELSCHGSPQVVDEIVAAAVAAGARVAEPGEFTRRAFLNGKLDLCQAEAVADLIAASSRAARRAALAQLRGRLSERVRDVRSTLLDLLADVEASIDFVEEGLEFFDRDGVRARLATATARLDALLATADDGLVLRSGVRIALAGAPNVGKSSLFNRLLEDDRSIVTEHPGTTRDVVRETRRAGELVFVLEDTAGLREDVADPVEQLGIARSRRSHAEADVVVQVVDLSRDLVAAEMTALGGLDASAAVVALNKSDLISDAERGAIEADPGAALRERMAARSVELPAELRCVALSAATGAGVGTLVDALSALARVQRLSLQNDALVTIAPRHREALLATRSALEAFATEAAAGEPPELLALRLRQAVESLDEVSGDRVREEVLDRIFARFCIGK